MFPRTSNEQKPVDMFLANLKTVDMFLDEENEINPSPEHVAEEMKSRFVNILTGEAVIQSERDDTCLTVYNPDHELLKMLKEIASSEGLFLWKP